MSDQTYTPLTDRALLTISGSDATQFLQGLVTCDVEHLKMGEIAFGALLSPQGKILFDFFIIAANDGFIVDVDESLASDLIKRLTFYKLRADVTIAPMDDGTRCFAIFGNSVSVPKAGSDGIFAMDPRNKAMGARAYLSKAPGGTEATLDDWNARRISIGMPHGGVDFSYGDAFPHEALMDQFAGVDFAKGCYVGQEVVSRMQHRGTARKRVIKVAAETALPEAGSDIVVAGKTCGTLGSIERNGEAGLALVRLDRAAVHASGEPAFAGDTPVTLSIADWCNFDWPQDD